MDIELNQLIEKNLKIVSESKTEFSYIYDLLDKDGYECVKYNGIVIADKMADRGLITRLNERIDLTELGRDIANNGGWITHLDRLAESKAKQKAKSDKKEQLETKIAELTEINLTLQNKQLRTKMLFSIIGFILGVIATNWKEILILLKLISPPETK